ncbi:SDR family oxidoreductase [Microtetraspora sp. NBRC 16547]|uniref:SDR family NAD(P)-dependent oxidoreductase n=1 Tax=Microtetraspora sp. NBRC 16547 TaxID=3030993 RepID=UPI0024A33D6A|nr:SDR family oxidoreductase [Microtetraspora sp. NBRC 16547]GLX02073.1 SDR family oxidoreductase [Microtetraspora sp. NBRC 16547]
MCEPGRWFPSRTSDDPRSFSRQGVYGHQYVEVPDCVQPRIAVTLDARYERHIVHNDPARVLRDLAVFVRADVRSDEDVTNLIDRTVDRFSRLDIAFNNAGTEGTPGPVTEVTDESYAATFDTNVLGTLLSMKHEFRVMRPQGGGSIINVSSTFGLMGYPNSALYVGSKHAVIGITKAAALEGAAHGIRVNAIAPGFTQTAMYERFTASDDVREAVNSALPMHRPGTPEEIAAAVLYIGSDKASYLTGQTIILDGGLTAGWPLLSTG